MSGSVYLCENCNSNVMDNGKPCPCMDEEMAEDGLFEARHVAGDSQQEAFVSMNAMTGPRIED